MKKQLVYAVSHWRAGGQQVVLDDLRAQIDHRLGERMTGMFILELSEPDDSTIFYCKHDIDGKLCFKCYEDARRRAGWPVVEYAKRLEVSQWLHELVHGVA